MHYSTFAEAAQLQESLPLVVFNPFRQKVPVRLWLRDLEESALEQVMALSNLSVVKGHVAVMPDAHAGIGCTVGSVFSAVDAVVPATIGVDIGCGMLAFRFPKADTARFTDDSAEAWLTRLHVLIKAKVPSGFSGHASGRKWKGLDTFPLGELETVRKGKRENFERVMMEKAPNQLGTLGGGNHFIELCVAENGEIWLILHSGSRGIGHAIGSHFTHVAKEWCDAHGIKRPRDLDYLPTDSQEGRDYVAGMTWAQSYAKENRHVMMQDLQNLIGNDKEFSRLFGKGVFAVENHHNFVQQETHFGEKVWVHRKGAVSAQLGELGILPGSMGVGSYIVSGLGNTESFCSCAHGSGRKMSRGQAKRDISVEDFDLAMEGIVGEAAENVLDEAPQAYKDLEGVMANQETLVGAVHRLRPILNVKGIK